ncbi:putative lipoprotein [Myxococcus xanthus DK 1622]|uniref:Lipoprotein n=2 Tax=Myxococcaceae TaxID=31 RepID=Q1D1Q9_MYXXD|nr:hypothetical protein [Myxococcus xanthus]ABF92971.1 putative lipoprotein [Myxococcus xanthus DK 1622]QVW66815.1 hypothetical protein JTM82_31365 [Myxococcus xanthus DZ2]NOJ53652.1 hypothetical protein [Myxococcus xanthus]QPM77747.1 hypothetical protein I5Q59_26015 [Myxococcus xanthus]UEO07057.1 hypothetical protein K1515_11425 [Myxococcus xanthus DZ2]
MWRARAAPSGVPRCPPGPGVAREVSPQRWAPKRRISSGGLPSRAVGVRHRGSHRHRVSGRRGSVHMRVGFWWVLAGLGLAGLGCGESVDAAAVDAVKETSEVPVQALACAPPGAVYKVKDVLPPGVPVPSNALPVPDWLTNAEGTLFFVVDLFDGPGVLWRSDGTSVGTVPVKEFPVIAGTYRDFSPLVAVGTRVFFLVKDPVVGRELWVSDGTEAGTRLVRDFAPGPASDDLMLFASVGDVLTFFRRPASRGPLELWRSDGTEVGTFRLVTFGAQDSFESGVPPVAGALLFTLHDAANGTYLWRTDGTAAGTTVVKRLDADLVWTQGTAVTATGLSVFSFYDEGPITEVWRTDGTPGGTVRLDSFGGYVRLLGALGGYVYVASGTAGGSALKLSRLSLAGGGKATATWLPNRYAGQPDARPYVEYSAVAGGKLYVSMAIGTSGPAPREVGLWVTDGTEAGTRELSRGLFTGDENYSPLFDTGAGTLLFSADGGETGLEPWVTDGTPGRTGLVADLSPLGGSNPQSFTRVGSTLFFRARSDTRGNALWAMPATVACPTQEVHAR